MILSEERIKQLTYEACSVFKDTDNEFDALVVERIMKRYAEAKEPLIATLRRHPDWDEENLAIIQKRTIKRGVDKDVARNLVHELNQLWETENYPMVCDESVEYLTAGMLPRAYRRFFDEVGDRWLKMSKPELQEMLNNLHLKRFFRDGSKGDYVGCFEEIFPETENLEHVAISTFVANFGSNYQLCENCKNFNGLLRDFTQSSISHGQFRVKDTSNFGTYIVNYGETEEGYAEFLEYWEKYKTTILEKYDGLKRESYTWLVQLIDLDQNDVQRAQGIERLEKLTGKNIGKKLKTTRVLQRYFEYLYQRVAKMAKFDSSDENELKEYEAMRNCVTAKRVMKMYSQKFAKLCDALTEKDFEREVVLSVHPIDYLLMSNGGDRENDESWESCHNIVDGCHMSGTISYMLDSVSLVGYTTVVENHRTNMAHRYKINRQMQIVFPNADAIMHSRLYPCHGDKSTFNQLATVVRDMVATAAGVEFGYSTDSDKSIVAKRTVEKCDGATLYPDWLRGYYTQFWSTVEPSELGTVEVGQTPRCIVCGDKHQVPGSLTCEDC